MASSSSSSNWVYDVFPSFSGEDVRVTFLSHLLKELYRKLIIAFKDNEIQRSQSLDPELKQAIRTSRIAVVVLSEKYSSSSWCLDELVEILKCKEEFGQLVIPVFYGLDPSHVRKQTGKFGEAFANTCLRKTENEIKLWRQSLTNVANVLGYHSQKWDNEAKLIEAIANEVLGKLNLTPSKDFEDFVGMEDHIANMSVLLNLDSEEVRMVGIWGSSGIGKTTLARTLYSQLSRRFQATVFVDKAFVSKSMDIYSNANPDDYNMKLHLLGSFLSQIFKKDMMIDRLDVAEVRLKNQKVLIFIDDLDEQVVLDTLVGQTHWFGCGSRIIVITKDRHFLKAHGIDHVYEVCLPSKKLALEMFCRSAFKKSSPPYGFMDLASEVALLAGNLPLGLKVLGSYLRGRKKEYWNDILPSLRKRLNGKIERTLRVSYDGLNNRKDEEIFRQIACLFNRAKIIDIKLMLVDSDFTDLDVNIGLENLSDKSLIHVRNGIVEMHSLLEDMGKDIVRAQSKEPGEREFLMDSNDICDLLEDNNGTKRILGIALDMDETEELHIHKNAFKGMRNLRFLKLYSKKWDQGKRVSWHLPEGFNYLPHKLRLLSLDGYPMKHMPINFRPENLVKLEMRGSKLERLWEGIHSLQGLKKLDLRSSTSLKELPDFSMATNLETLELSNCSSLVELPSSIQYLNKLEKLIMSRCINLETLPMGINLQSLDRLDLAKCSNLKSFPDISTNISVLFLSESWIEEFPSNMRLENLHFLNIWNMKSEKMWKQLQPLTPLMNMLPQSLKSLCLSDIPTLVELPSSVQLFHELENLRITDCINLETLPTGINFPFLYDLDLSGCPRLKTFPDISTNITNLYLDKTGIEEVPWWIENFSRLNILTMNGCNKLRCVSLHITKLKNQLKVHFTECRALTEASWNDATKNVHSSFPESFINCFIHEEEQPRCFNRIMLLSGEEVLSYFNHRTTETSLTNIPLLGTSLSLSQPFFRFKACAVVDTKSSIYDSFEYEILVSCHFKGSLGNHFDSPARPCSFYKREKGIHLAIFDCSFPLNQDSASLADLSYHHLDIQFHLSNYESSTSELKGCGIRLSQDFLSTGNPNTLPHVPEAHEQDEECLSSCVKTETTSKRMRIT